MERQIKSDKRGKIEKGRQKMTDRLREKEGQR